MLRVFCDFDGTICRDDVGREFFRTFVGEERAKAIVQDYLDGSITASESLTRECAAVDDCSEAMFGEFEKKFEVDQSFPAFAQFCSLNQIPLTVLSDGLDKYVQPILARAKLESVPWFANRLEFKREAKKTTLGVDFPYSDAECDRCGNCKRNHMLTLSADEDVIVYIGDGISDRCPARFADIVFAKRSLIKYCQLENISFFEFNDFNDVLKRLEPLVGRKRLKHRREAVMARRDVFAQG